MIHHCPEHDVQWVDDHGCIMPGCLAKREGPVPNTTGDAHTRRMDLAVREAS